MGKAPLFCLLDNFSVGTPQHYVLAVQLRRQHADRSRETSIAEQVPVCEVCRAEVRFDVRYAYNFGKAFCDRCAKNVGFKLLVPIPHEAKAPMSLEEIHRKLREKFGDP